MKKKVIFRAPSLRALIFIDTLFLRLYSTFPMNFACRTLIHNKPVKCPIKKTINYVEFQLSKVSWFNILQQHQSGDFSVNMK